MFTERLKTLCLRTGLVTLLAILSVSWLPVASSADKPIRIIASLDEDMSSTSFQAMKAMLEEIKEKTGGKVTYDLYPKMALSGGNIRTMIQQTQMGAIHVSLIPSSIYTSWDPKFNLYSLPFLFRDIDDAYKLYESQVARVLMDRMEQNELVGVSTWVRSLRQFLNNKRPIESPSDMRGLRLRVPEIKLWISAFKRLGADPTPMPFGEVYTAVQLGSVDGLETPTTHIYSEKFYEIVKYVTFSNYATDALIVAYNKAFFKGLPNDVQRILVEAARNAAEGKYKLDKSIEADIERKIREKGVIVTHLAPDKAKAFRDVVIPVWGEFEGEIGRDLIDETKRVLGL